MKRIDYFKVFGFLAFMGSAFLSTVFHHPSFTIAWFIIVLVFALALAIEADEMTISAFVALAYVPLGLISLLSKYTNKVASSPTAISGFAFLLIIFVVIEGVLAGLWCVKNSK